MKKRTLTVLLVLVIAITLLSTFANAKSVNDALTWLNAQDYAEYNLDGAYGCQCSDFVSAYMNWLYTGDPWSGSYGVYNANYYPTAASWRPDLWDIIENYNDFIPQPGDIFVSVGSLPEYGHVGVVISSDKNTATIIDQNGINASDWGSPARIHSINWSGAYAPTYFIRYKGFGGSSPTPSIIYSDITPGDYCILNVGTQAYLTVDNGIDQNTQNVSVHSFWNSTAYKMSVTKVSDAYKIRPLCCSSRLINPYADTVVSGKNVNIYDDVSESSQWWRFETYGNAYIIRNAQNPNCVLTVSGENVLVENFTGSANQQWTLHPAVEKVHYNANGGTGAPASQDKYHAVDLTLSSQIPTRSGYTFLGWSMDANATAAQYSAGGNFSHWAGTTLYAVWKKNPHVCSFTNYIYNNDATCVNDGTETATCTCGKTNTRTRANTATGNHSWVNYIYNNDATCVNDGTETATCTCGKTNTRTKANTATGNHSWVNYIYNNDATCVNDGTETATCTCGKTNTRTKANTATGNHSWVNYIYNNDATCVNDGTETATCTCGKTNTRTRANTATGNHNWGQYIYNNDATTELDGTKTHTCSICGKAETVVAVGTKLNSGSIMINTSIMFTDIKSKAWYKQYVDYSVTKGIFTGTSATTFSPDTNITRAQFVQVLANLSGVDTDNRNVLTSFSDVPRGKWYTAAVKWASENSVVNGMGGGKFAPNANVTREQMCLMLVNYSKFKNITLNVIEEKASFADDKSISKWAKSAVYTCQQADIVNGKGANSFDPQGTGTRAEASVMFTKFHKDYLAK